MTAREEILGRIRRATGAASSPESHYAAIERTYQSAASMSREAALELFIERLVEYDATVERVAADEIPATIERVLQRRGVSLVLVPEGIPPEWKRGAEFVEDTGFSSHELDAFQTVLTGASMGIAETGTIVLQNVAGEGRRAITLVPDHHVCIVAAGSVRETVVEAMRALEATKHLPTTFFSGPSATADIEMTRIKGVHGPRFVDVILVD